MHSNVFVCEEEPNIRRTVDSALLWNAPKSSGFESATPI